MELQPSISLAQQMQLFGSSGSNCVVDSRSTSLSQLPKIILTKITVDPKLSKEPHSTSLSQLPKIVLSKITVDPKLFKLKEHCSSSNDKASCTESSEIQISDRESSARNSSMVVSFPLTKHLKSWFEKKCRPSHKLKHKMGRSRLKPTSRMVVRKGLRVKRHAGFRKVEKNDCKDETESGEMAESVEELNRVLPSCEQEKKEVCSESSKEKAATSECGSKVMTKPKAERNCDQSVDSVLKSVRAYHKQIKKTKLRERVTTSESERRPIKRTSKSKQRLSFDDSDESDEPTEPVSRPKEWVESQGPATSEPEIGVVLDDGDFGIVVDQPPLNNDNFDVILFNQSSESVVANTSTGRKNASNLPKKQLYKSRQKAVKQIEMKTSSKEGTKTTKRNVKVYTKPGKTVIVNTNVNAASKKGTKDHKQNSLDASSQSKKKSKSAGMMSDSKKGKDQDGGFQKRRRGRSQKNSTKTQPAEKKSWMTRYETDKSKLSLDLPEDPAQLQSSIDSGYPTSASSYETSSLTGPNSKSPDLMTPNLVLTEFEPLGHHSHGLILDHKDPILQDSKLNDPEFPNQVLDSTQVLTVFDPSFLQSLHANFTIDETQQRMGLHTSSNQDPIFPELEILLNQNVSPEQLLDPANQIVIERVETLNGNENETVEVCEVDDILQSETVAQCLKELQQSGRISCGPSDNPPMSQEHLAQHNQQQIPSCTEMKNMASDLCKPAGEKAVFNPPRQRVVYQVDSLLAAPLPQSGADNVDTRHVLPDTKATKKGKRGRKKSNTVRTEKEEDTTSLSTVSSPPDSPTWSSPDSSDGEHADTALPLMSRTKSGRKLKPSWKVVANALPGDSNPIALLSDSDSSAPSAEFGPKSPVVDSNTSAPSTNYNTIVPLIVTSPTHCIDNPVPSPRVPDISVVSPLPPPAAETPHLELGLKKLEKSSLSRKEPIKSNSQGKREKIIFMKNGEKKRKVKIIRSTVKKLASPKQLKTSDSFSDSTTACKIPLSALSSVSTSQKDKVIPSVGSNPPLRKKVLCFSPTLGQVEVTLLDCELKLSRCDVSGLTKKEGVKPHKEELSKSKDKVPPVSSCSTNSSAAVRKKEKISTSFKDETHSQSSTTKCSPVLNDVANGVLKTSPATHLDGKVKTTEIIKVFPPATESIMTDVSYKTLESGGTSNEKKNTVTASNSLSMSLDVILKEMESESLKTSSQKPKKTTESSSDSDLLNKGFDTHSLVSYTHESSLCPLPDLDFKEVSFHDPLENTPYSCDYSISLTDQEITNLILSPLADDESSDPEINTENLFAPPSQEDSVQPSGVMVPSPGKGDQCERRPSEKLKSKITLTSADQAESPHSGGTDKSRTVCVEAEIGSRHGEDEDGTQKSEMSDREHTSLLPIPAKKFHLSEGGEDGGEDCIDLYPEDGDIFAQDTDEDPLAKIFPKATTSKIKTPSREINKCGLTPSNNSAPGVLPIEFCDTNSSLDCEVSSPVSMPYKKKQVSQWVAEQQRRVSGNFIPPGPLLGHGMFNFHSHGLNSFRNVGPHTMVMTPSGGVSNNSRGLLNTYGDLQCTPYSKPPQGLCRPYLLDLGPADIPPPPRPMPPPLMRTSSPVPNPFFATTLPSGPRSTHSQESVSEAVVTTPTLPTIGGLGGYCKNFIRGFCTYMPCRFRHVHRDSAPLSVLEEALFRLPFEKIPVDVVSRFVADFHSNSLVKNKFSSFVDLVRALLDRNFGQTLSHYKHLTKFGVKFAAPFLSQLLELCTFQSPSVQPQLLTFIEDIFNTIKRVRGHHNSEDYHTFLKVLVNCDAKKQASRVYNSMKNDRVEPMLDTLFLMLRLGKLPDYSPILLLEDIKLCHPKPVEEARIVNRIIDTAEYPFSKDHSTILGKWLEASPAVADKLTFECYHRLFKTFSFNQHWGYFISLLKNCPCHLHDMRSHVCALLIKSVEQLGPTVNVMCVVEKLSEEQTSGIDVQVWNTILLECAKKGRSQRATKFYKWLSEKKKHLPAETYIALMEMYLKQHCPSACITVLRDALKQSPPVVPPVNLLNPICQTLEKAKDISDIMLIIRAQLTTNVNPPAVILDTLFSISSKEKIHSKLAEVVKLSCECGAILDKEFYQKCLIELRQWGRDQDAISAVYKALRKVEGLDDSLTLSSPKRSTAPLPKRPPSVQLPCPPSPTHATSISPPPLTNTAGDKRKTESSTSQVGDMSLEGVLQRSTAQDMSNVLHLIQVNGTQGQFGAVAAILVSVQSTNSLYDSNTIHAVWKAVTSSPERAANAFSNLLLHLDQFRSATVNAGIGKSLLACDRWLISQIGIALMRTCEQSQDWQSGFVILHHLHRYGVHYVNYSHPHSSLPPLMPHPPSSCSVALMAVNMCLHVNQITGALEVLRGCEWVKASRSDEFEPRTELLCSLAEKCLESKMYQDVWKCLEAVEFCTVLKKFIHVVTNLHNKLLQSVLATEQSDFALTIYRGMRSAKLQCLPSIFSNMLQSLCDSKQEDLTRDLCMTAISEGSYCPLVQDNLFKVFLPMGLVRVEIHLLLEEHLRRVAREVWKDKDNHQPLYIQFGTGCRHILEQVLAEEFSPNLKAVFAGKSACNATIPASSLQQWFNKNETISVPQTLSVGETTSNADQKSSTVVRVGQKRRFSSFSSDGGVVREKGNSVTREVEHLYNKVPRLCTDPSDIDSIASSQECCIPLSSLASVPKRLLSVSEKAARKKQFREAVCRTFVDKLKPYYQAKKFKTPDDYTHLLRTLSRNFFKNFKSFNCTVSSSTSSADTWDLKDSVRNEIASIVSRVMLQCTVYSKDLDTQLGL